MNAADVFQQIAGIPGASQSGAAGSGLIDGRLISRIEFVHTNSMPERSFRAAWRRRRANTAPALVLFTDDPESPGHLMVLGPSKPDDPIRSVPADAFVALVFQIAELKGVTAVRTFESEIGTMDATGGAGLVIHGVGSEHLFRHRLPDGHGLPEGSSWENLETSVKDFNGGDWLTLLKHLGYTVKQRPDRGHLATVGNKSMLVIHSVQSADEFTRLNDQGILREGALLADCQDEGVQVGLLAAGDRIRIYLEDDEGGALNRFLQIDINGIEEDLRPLLGLLAPDEINADVFGTVLAETLNYGTKLRDRLDQSLRQEVLPVLGLELGRAAASAGEDLSEDLVRDELEGAALTFVFRALFLLYAEGAGYLPMQHDAYQSRSLTRLCERAANEKVGEGEEATTLWDDFSSVVNAMRTGKPAWGVPPYNGELFAADGLKGADRLEKYSISDQALAPALAALGRDTETDDGPGLDYSGLEIGHLGHTYEGLLSLRLSVAETDLTYVARDDRYRLTPAGEVPDINKGELTWLTDEGGRKGGGVYYTPVPLVRHLVRQSVRPAFEGHLEEIRSLIETEPQRAADQLFEFHVVDPACGSAHFLVQVADELADQVAKLMGSTPMPGIAKELESLRGTAGKTYDLEIEDAALLKRLVIKQCVFGVDVSEMGVEIAKLSLWLAGFVPGLSLAYLDRNIICGNSLVGVIDPDEVSPDDQDTGMTGLFGGSLSESLRSASKTANELQQIPDRTPDEIGKSREKNTEYEAEVAGANRLMDIWTASFLGHVSARDRALQAGAEILGSGPQDEDIEFIESSRGQNALHWPTAFAETFSRDNPGFDVVVGNPPWDEVTVEELAFYARYQPGLRALPNGPRREALEKLKAERPDLAAQLQAEKERAASLRAYLSGHSPDAISAGDPDLYKYFAHRYQGLLREEGRLGVVLPREALFIQGMAGFRQWLAAEAPLQRVDFLVNSGKWAFDAEQRMTVCLLSAQRGVPTTDVEVAGVATSQSQFAEQSTSPGVSLSTDLLGDNLEIPMAESMAQFDLFKRMEGTTLARGGGAWKCIPATDLHESNDKEFFEDETEGWELWKGRSFDQYEPSGNEAIHCPITDDLWRKVTKVRGFPGKESPLVEEFSVAERRAAVAKTVGKARVAFRDVTRATDSRTVRACLVPPETLLLNSSPYLSFLEGGPLEEAACLGVMNSVPVDWLARRWVEKHLNYFVLNLIRVPTLNGEVSKAIGQKAARLSSIDDRFKVFADSCSVDCGPLEPEQRLKLLAEIDALVARAWELSSDDLELIFGDFSETDAAVSANYREAILSGFEELT